ncbi:uncharacterized protein AB9W97_020026 isoform 3-T5 [Spinachia spinachia]
MFIPEHYNSFISTQFQREGHAMAESIPRGDGQGGLLELRMEELTSIKLLTNQMIEVQTVERKSDLQRTNLGHNIQEALERITDLQKVEANQKHQIIKLCEEKDAWQEEKKLLEDTCLRLKRKTQGDNRTMKDRESELAEIRKWEKECKETEKSFSSPMQFWKELTAGTEASMASLPPTAPSPSRLESLQEKKMGLGLSSLKESLRGLQEPVKDHEAEMAEARQTIARQRLEVSRLKESLRGLQETVKDHEAEMAEARQTIERQRLEDSSLKETLQGLQETVKDHEAEMAEARQTIARQRLEVSSVCGELQREGLSESRRLLTNSTAELPQSQTSCKKEDLTVRRELDTLKGESQMLMRAFLGAQLKNKRLEQDQHLLEDICLQMKKRTLGLFGRRMGDRATEMAKMRSKMVKKDTEAASFPQVFSRRTHNNTTRVEEAPPPPPASTRESPPVTAGLNPSASMQEILSLFLSSLPHEPPLFSITQLEPLSNER